VVGRVRNVRLWLVGCRMSGCGWSGAECPAVIDRVYNVRL